ncbi:hypothetical protein AXF42_Ash001403 [Apostasia shenzhenica]|uniref:Uncharacterized protein n=1 Tax=Apostasia shenzhenica TaxID=1088818 RepID=A0A2I0AUU1_9ASPA|nr:hypothetical protein AXF42_Ash001403 [Apostasia shenzhenica]
MASSELSAFLPRVLIVSRRCVRKNKFVDFVGEYHLDLIVGYGAVPVIVPRVAGVHLLLDSFEPIHGVLLCEGEDIDPGLYDAGSGAGLTPDELEEVRLAHAGDTAVDREKDSIELRLARLCLDSGIPFLGICRGSQVLNVACGGTLYRDVKMEMLRGGAAPVSMRRIVEHINYEDYDGHRHPVEVVEGTPLHDWFGELAAGEERRSPIEIKVNSYHHQGVKRLAERFVPMAFSPDGLVEGFYDPKAYNPAEGKFMMGLQFHPERMRGNGAADFDYPGCPRAYQEFVKAVRAYQDKVNAAARNRTGLLEMDQEMEKKRKVIVKSFSVAKDLYAAGHGTTASKQPDLEAGAEFLEVDFRGATKHNIYMESLLTSNTVLSLQQEKRLKQMGATVRNSTSYLLRMKMNKEREAVARNIMGKMPVEQLSELLSFYHMMGQLCSEVLERKLSTS